jgi:predicted regulator of Ras-like GTPase activity (Roadblock/LC7/MglB family)
MTSLSPSCPEGYAAVYQQSSPALVVVYGLRFATIVDRDELLKATRTPQNSRVMSVGIGSILAVVHGDGGECAQTIGTYLASLAKQ